MPEPEWAEMDYDPYERPHIGAEIIGRGAKSRRSKTYIQSVELAAAIARVEAYIPVLENHFRRLHARHYRVKVTSKQKDGTEVTQEIPQVLSNTELRSWYPIIKEWDSEHDDLVEHFASIKGFSVNRATGVHEDAPRERRREESSAASERREGPEGRWR